MRQVTATLWRSTGPGQDRVELWKRHFSWMDTALPRIIQVLLREGQVSDLVVFHSTDIGFEIGVVELKPKNKIRIEYSDLVKSSSTLMRVFNMGS